MSKEENETARPKSTKLRCPDCGGGEIWIIEVGLDDRARCADDDCGWTGKISEAEDAARGEASYAARASWKNQGLCIACGGSNVAAAPSRGQGTAAFATSMQRCKDCGASFSKAMPGLTESIPRRKLVEDRTVAGMEKLGQRGLLKEAAGQIAVELAKKTGFLRSPVEGDARMTCDGVWQVFDGQEWSAYIEEHKP